MRDIHTQENDCTGEFPVCRQTAISRMCGIKNQIKNT